MEENFKNTYVFVHFSSLKAFFKIYVKLFQLIFFIHWRRRVLIRNLFPKKEGQNF